MADAVIGGSLDWDDFDPLDVVMREDWGMLDIPAKLRGPMLKYALDLQQKVGRSGSGGSGASSRLTTSFLARKPQSLVKLIRNGGTSDLRGMRDQMDYLRKEGTVELERSDRYLGQTIDDELERQMMRFWQLADDGEGKADRTSHIVVSFPVGTDHGAAYKAGREWAEDMFASGKYGDHFDYYTAFHTDREHPHMHVVVNRRGLEDGEWLKISPRGHFDYDEMRFAQVRVAARHGITLEATPRAARGIEERPYTDCEVQRARREGRAPQPKPHGVISRLQAKLHTSIFVRQVEADAGLIDKQYPDFTKAMREAAHHLREGKRLKATGPKWIKVGAREIRMLDEAIEKHRNKILQNFARIDVVLADVPEGAEKIRLEREGASIRTEAAKFMPDMVELRDYRRPSETNAYKGIKPYDDYTSELAEKLQEQIADLADQAGLDGAQFAARYDGKSVPKAVSEKWLQQERSDIARQFEVQGRDPHVASQQAEEIVQAFHETARSIVISVNRDIKAYEARKVELLANLEAGQSDQLADQLKSTLTKAQLTKLERGNVATLSSITPDKAQQHHLARHYLKAALLRSHVSRRAELQKALHHVEQSEQSLKTGQQQRQSKGRSKSARDDGGFSQ